MEEIVMITSRQNERIRDAKRLQQKKYRDQLGMFYIEGVRFVEEALSTPLVEEVFYTPRLLEAPRGQELVNRAQSQGILCFRCNEAVMAELTETVHSQGVVATVKKPSWSLEVKGVMLIADGIQDPGNMGTLLRTAVGAGIKGLFVVEGSVDLYNPKVLRSSMGAVFHLPHCYSSRQEIIERVKESHSTLVIADLVDSEDYAQVHYPKNVAVVIGNEARGVHKKFRDRATLRVQIPLIGQIESLNASVAAGVLLYEILRQHRCENFNSVL